MDYDKWDELALSDAERHALELIVSDWQAGRSTRNDHVLYALVRAGWDVADAQVWIGAAQSESPRLLERSVGDHLVPTLTAALALAANPAVRRDLDDLERLVSHLHRSYHPDHPEFSRTAISSALVLPREIADRLLQLAGLSILEDRIFSGNEPLYWSSFEAFLERRVSRIAPRVADLTDLPIDAYLEQVDWLGLGPYRAPTVLRLAPMTVLVGANGVGKTTALLALGLLRGLAKEGAAAIGNHVERINTHAPELMVQATATLRRPGAASIETVVWQLVADVTTPRGSLRESLRRVRPAPVVRDTAELATFARGTGRWRDAHGALVEHTMRPGELALTTATEPAAHSQLLALRQSLRRWSVFPTLPRRPASSPQISAKVLLPEAYLDHPDHFAELRSVAQRVCGIRDLRHGEAGDLQILDPSGTWLDAHLAATGVVRALDILTRLLAPEPPPLFAIDELENHLHGDLAARLLDVMRSVSTRTQIVVTTHSARVLRCFAASEVRLVRRGAAGSTIVAVDQDPKLRRLAEAGDLGALIEDGYFTGAV